MQTAIAPEQLENAAQEFVNYCVSKGFIISQEFLNSVVEELKDAGLWVEKVSLKTYKAGLNLAIDSGKIMPPVKPTISVKEAAEKLQAAYPPVMTERELARQKRIASANAGIASQTGRVSHGSEMSANHKVIDDKYAGERTARENLRLRSEFKKALNDAQMLTVGNGRSHGQNQAARKEAVNKIMSDPKFASVRNSS